MLDPLTASFRFGSSFGDTIGLDSFAGLTIMGFGGFVFGIMGVLMYSPLSKLRNTNPTNGSVSVKHKTQ